MIVVFIFSAILQCLGLPSGQPSRPSKTYFPNTRGDYWEYAVYDSSKTRDHPDFQRDYTVRITVGGSVNLADGKPATVWQYQYPWGKDTGYVRMDGDTIKIFDRIYSSSVRALSFPRQLFIQPFVLNSSWEGKLLFTDSFRVVDRSTVTTPAQTFTGCYTLVRHYRGPNLEYKDRFWFKPYTGMVRIDYHQYNMGVLTIATWQLKRYSLH
ncbi:MAG TPA: hypothetical protein VK563_15820 [Puia sp.]|nr:hypothetical protein [Puia sp.]